ncbi:MAG: substrate-binding domain-containing protein, partial [Bryobacterales bacterium]|nr:substrate-binding domain-containing protein [Bryobacterales bacterium]
MSIANRSSRLLLPALPLLAAGCSRGLREKAADIVLVTKALDSEWWQRVKAGAEAAARAEPGVRLAVLAPEREINLAQQVAILEDQILKKPAALAVAPCGIAQILPVLDKAKAAGIPVLIVDTDLPWPPRLSFLGIDNRLGGRLAGDYIVRAI